MKIHDAIGLAAFPPVLDIFVTLVFVFFSPIGIGLLKPLSAILISLLFITIIPLFPVTHQFRRGLIDLYISNRKQRTFFYIIAIVSYLMAAFIFLAFQSSIMFYLMLSYTLIAVAVLAINFHWKISAHTAGIAGPMTAIAYVFGWHLLLLHFLTAIVIWSRITTKGHTIMQAMAGCAVSILVTLVVFYYFMPF